MKTTFYRTSFREAMCDAIAYSKFNLKKAKSIFCQLNTETGLFEATLTV